MLGRGGREDRCNTVFAIDRDSPRDLLPPLGMLPIVFLYSRGAKTSNKAAEECCNVLIAVERLLLSLELFRHGNSGHEDLGGKIIAI